MTHVRSIFVRMGVRRAYRQIISAVSCNTTPPLPSTTAQTLAIRSFQAGIQQQMRRFGTNREPTSFVVQDVDDFADRVLHSETPVIVDFHADWCGPCKMLGPRLESKIDNKQGAVLMAKVNIDDLQDLAIDYGVQAVPTVMTFKGGEKVDEFVGLKDDVQLDVFIDNAINQ